jgi:flagellar hook-length control protein FliK
VMKDNLVINYSDNFKNMSANEHKKSSDSNRISGNAKNKFQLMFIKSVEKSQSEIDRNTRLKNSTVKEAGTAQPRVSEQLKEYLNASRLETANTLKDFQQENDSYGEGALNTQGEFINKKIASTQFSIDRATQLIIEKEIAKQSFIHAALNDHNFVDDDAKLSEQSDINSSNDQSDLKNSETDASLLIRLKTVSEKLLQEQPEQKRNENSNETNVAKQMISNEFAISSIQYKESEAIHHSAPPVLSTTEIINHFGSEAWSDELNQKIIWMTRGAEQSATLTLNPPHLGPITVQVKMLKHVAHTIFESSNSEVRTALESGLPKLREMLSARGVELGGVSVKDVKKNFYQ